MMKPISIIGFVMFCFGAIAILSSSKDKGDKTNSDAKPSKSTTSSAYQNVRAIDLPSYVEFAGEPLPMDNFDVKERLDRELLVNTYWHSNTILNIKKAMRFMPLFEQILAEEGVPDDFKYLAVAESSLRYETSPAGAKGLWQFMRGTAKDYGMVVNGEVDERLNVEKSTRAAAKYIKKLHKRFGSYTLAAAAYNVGAAKLSKQITAQKAASYYDLNLNIETGRYVFRITAIKEILNNPSVYGFYIDHHQKYPPLDNYNTVTVDGAVSSWADFAQKHGMSYRMLKVYNPWMISTALTNKEKRSYIVKIAK